MSSTTQKQKRNWLSDTWFLEIGAITLSIISLVVILILLLHYNNHPQLQWHGVTLNAVVSILATVARIGLVVPVAESLAQWKWMWFSHKPRPLADFELLDDASRGSRGSIMLLWEKKSWTIAAIGAWIIVLSAAIEPFIQQIISYQDSRVYSDNPTVQIPFAAKWSGGTEVAAQQDYGSSSPNGVDVILLIDSYSFVQDVHLDFSAQAAVLFGLSSDANHVAQQLPVTCSTGNCTWPSYLSLAVCSACSDVSNMVSHAPKVDFPMEWAFPTYSGYSYDVPVDLTTYFLPNGVNIENRDPGSDNTDQSYPVVMTARSTPRPSETLTLQDYTTLLFSISVLRVGQSSFPSQGQWTDLNNVTIEATECGLYLCVKEYDSQVRNGDLVEISTEIAATRSNVSWQVDLQEDQTINEYLGDITPNVDALFDNATYFPRTDLMIEVPPNITSSNDLRSVNISQAGVDSLSDYLSSLFDDGTFNVTLPAGSDTRCTLAGAPEPCGQIRNITGMVTGDNNFSAPEVATNFQPPVMRILWASPSLPDTFANLAESISNEMRKNAENQPQQSGRLGTLQTLLQVRWPWITLPVFCTAVSLLFLTVSIGEAQRNATPLWKSNGLAPLYHGLESKVRKTIEHSVLPSKMSREAEDVKVRLTKGEDDVWMLRYDTSTDPLPSPAKVERTPLTSSTDH